MLKLYAVPISLYCAKLRIVLRHKQLDWKELPPPGGYGSEEYKSLVSAGNLPALDHDGLILGDSEAIAEYLNEAFPEPEMLPGTIEQRAKVRALSRFHDTRLEPALRALFPHLGSAERDKDAVSKLWIILGERLAQCTALLPDAPRELTLGDCGYPITCTWIDQLTTHFDLPPLIAPKMQSYLDWLSKHAAVATELADYQPKLEQWLASK